MKTNIEKALRRRAGASEETRAKMKANGEKVNDWFAKCPKCGAQLRGTMAELLAHRHDDEAS